MGLGSGVRVQRRWKWNFAVPLEVDIKYFGGTIVHTGHGSSPSPQSTSSLPVELMYMKTFSENQVLKLCDIDYSRGIPIRDKSMWICFLENVT